MRIDILSAESLGARGLCCVVEAGGRRIVIDPGVALGYVRHGLLPHPRQVARGRQVRRAIIDELAEATDVVFSHFHGDHVPLADANPYQLSLSDMPPMRDGLRAWCASDEDLSPTMRGRFEDLGRWLGERLRVAAGEAHGPLTFSCAVAHGLPGAPTGEVMMTRVDLGDLVFVHASDIQLLDAPAIDTILDWEPDVVLAAGPPLYLDRLSAQERAMAWDNALRLARPVDRLILDHHLMRSDDGPRWLEQLTEATGRRVLCAADHQNVPRCMLEARRSQLYRDRPVPDDWHERYAERFAAGRHEVTGPDVLGVNDLTS